MKPHYSNTNNPIDFPKSKNKMNERIKELAIEAGYQPLPGFDFANSLEETYLKKFAQLIVRECIAELESVKVNEYRTDVYDIG
jgi:hypothetical protein